MNVFVNLVIIVKMVEDINVHQEIMVVFIKNQIQLVKVFAMLVIIVYMAVFLHNQDHVVVQSIFARSDHHYQH